ncbi:MAG: hypothetical protein GY757_43020 [bacterium]|nr:hypothetical protein [bacterium]
MYTNDQEKRDFLAQWAFDTRPILARFHIWLEGIEVKWRRGQKAKELTTEISFLNGGMERLFAMTGAVTALGTQLFGRFGDGAKLDKAGLNQVKKDADAISAYAMSESLWFLSRQLPENHAIMVCLGEGLMPKAGETPEMGSNPQLGFGRIYARPEVAKWLDDRVIKLLNQENYEWTDFYKEIKDHGLTIWGAAIDTLENTSRFAKGKDTGPMTVLHLFNQPLHIARPYEGYVGNLFLPKKVVEKAADESILINFRTPRALVVKAIELAYPGIKRQNIHVWTLQGKNRTKRIGELWKEWEELGTHLVDDNWKMPSGIAAFTDSGTYAPIYSIGSREENGETHLFICDGYAASAEAVQAASLAPMLGLEAFLSIFTSKFSLPYNREQNVMRLSPTAPDFRERLQEVVGEPMDDAAFEDYKFMINEGIVAGVPLNKPSVQADDFFPEKYWDVLAVCGFMGPDPYSGNNGVQEVRPGVYEVTVRMATPRGEKDITFTLRLTENQEVNRLMFNPLLSRFMAGEDFRSRPVRISDSGRIRNELQTLCSEALEFFGQHSIRIFLDRIPRDVIPLDKQKRLLEVLNWYQKHHPIWFCWLDIVEKEK